MVWQTDKIRRWWSKFDRVETDCSGRLLTFLYLWRWQDESASKSTQSGGQQPDASISSGLISMLKVTNPTSSSVTPHLAQLSDGDKKLFASLCPRSRVAAYTAVQTSEFNGLDWKYPTGTLLIICSNIIYISLLTILFYYTVYLIKRYGSMAERNVLCLLLFWSVLIKKEDQTETLAWTLYYRVCNKELLASWQNQNPTSSKSPRPKVDALFDHFMAS